MKANAVVKTVTRNTLPDVKAEAIVAFLADTVEAAKRDTYTNKLANIKAKTLDENRHKAI